METISRKNCELFDHFEHKTVKNSDKTRLRARRNGKTKTWKRDVDRFMIPVKHGLYDYFYISENNCNEWEGE